jgi:integrase
MGRHPLSTEVSDSLDQLPEAYRAGLEAGIDLLNSANAASTRDVYERAFHQFEIWCATMGHTALPSDWLTVFAYMGYLRTPGEGPDGEQREAVGASRLGVVMSAIAWKHKSAGYPNPTVHEVIEKSLRGARNQDARARPPKKAHAITGAIEGVGNELCQLLDSITGDDLAAIRDRALLLLFWSGCFRRGEIAGLRLGDLNWKPQGLWIPAGVSKADQEGRGRKEGKGKAIPLGANPKYCPVIATRLWIKVLERLTGREAAAGASAAALPVFVGFRPGKAIRDEDGLAIGRELHPREAPMSGQAINDIVQARAVAAGIEADRISSHGLRRGWLTTAAENGVDMLGMQGQSHHRSVQMLSEYVAVVDAFRRLEGAKLL